MVYYFDNIHEPICLVLFTYIGLVKVLFDWDERNRCGGFIDTNHFISKS